MRLQLYALTWASHPVWLLCCPACQPPTAKAANSMQTKNTSHLLQLDLGNFRSATRTASCLIKLGRFEEALLTLQHSQAALPAGSRPPREWQTKMQELNDAKRLLEEVSFCRLVVRDNALQDADTTEGVWFTSDCAELKPAQETCIKLRRVKDAKRLLQPGEVWLLASRKRLPRGWQACRFYRGCWKTWPMIDCNHERIGACQQSSCQV